ncbi:MAG: MFS transporter [Verrucomicrobia bacterium]|nr:MFS transporter [Verrucomicrobiota bacterium]
MNPDGAPTKPFTLTEWLILTVAAIGFLFDTYELLLLPLIAAPAIAEILQVPANNPLVTDWVGRLLWIAALCGGVFGLIGGWLTDRIGRKTMLAVSIAIYSLSPVAAAFTTTLGWFVFFRCATFVGVCLEFVAAITWLAELFPDKGRREKVLGWTQAFASVGGIFVTVVNGWILKHAATLPALPLPQPFDAHADWRYTLMTGLLPAIPIALLLPFVPESRVWQEKRRAGTLRRSSFAELFSPELRRTTLVTAALSACAYGIAFGALQLTPTRIMPGIADLAEPQKILRPLQAEAAQLNKQFDDLKPRFEQACAEVAGLRELSGQRGKARRELRATGRALQTPDISEAQKAALQTTLAGLTNQIAALDGELDKLTASAPEAKKAVLEREKILGQLGANREKQAGPDNIVKTRGKDVQLWQEIGGLLGRIALAALLALAISKGMLLRLFQVPGLIVLPLTYYWLFRDQPALFHWGVAICGFLTVAQFSYFGEYLPKVFPLHLRGTGGSFATNVGGRMLGTSAAFVTTNLVAPMLGGRSPAHVATAAAIVGTSMFLIGLGLSFLLPEPKAEKSSE